jgi:hypothetical protein
MLLNFRFVSTRFAAPARTTASGGVDAHARPASVEVTSRSHPGPNLGRCRQIGNASPEIKNIVLVHGGFVDGSGWQGVYDRLTADGYRVFVVQNPTL